MAAPNRQLKVQTPADRFVLFLGLALGVTFAVGVDSKLLDRSDDSFLGYYGLLEIFRGLS